MMMIFFSSPQLATPSPEGLAFNQLLRSTNWVKSGQWSSLRRTLAEHWPHLVVANLENSAQYDVPNIRFAIRALTCQREGPGTVKEQIVTLSCAV